MADDEERTRDAYESLTSLKVIALQRQIQQKQKELDEVWCTGIILEHVIVLNVNIKSNRLPNGFDI